MATPTLDEAIAIQKSAYDSFNTLNKILSNARATGKPESEIVQLEAQVQSAQQEWASATADVNNATTAAAQARKSFNVTASRTVTTEITEEDVTGDSTSISSKESKTLANSDKVSASASGVTQDLTLTNQGKKEAAPEKAAAKTTPARKSITYIPRPNQLHQYATYTYGVSLYILTKNDYNNLIQSPGSWTPRSGNCLISHGGGHGASKPRNKNWNDDFYFDGLKLSSIIGMNSTSRAANVVELDFTVIEPMGFTFIDRLLQTSYDINTSDRGINNSDAPNYVAMPYLLQVEFFGYDDQGNQKALTQFTKYFPIKMLSCKSKVTVRGSEYNIKATPFNHSAYADNVVSTPVNMEVSAKTVGDFFENSNSDSEVMSKFGQLQREKDVRSKMTKEVYDRAVANGVIKPEEEKKPLPSPKVKSYTGAYNGWQDVLIAGKKIQHPTKIKFEIDSEIKNARFSMGKQMDSGKTPLASRSNSKELSANIKGNDPKSNNSPNNVDSNVETVAVQAGDNIVHIINKIIMNSEYITNQLVDPMTGRNIDDPAKLQEKSKTPNNPLNWFKIIPSIEITNFDYTKNEWSYNVTYHVRSVPYNNDGRAVYAPVSKPNGAVKEYNYIYTGLNTDIIDFNIDFDALYYTAVSANRAEYQKLNDTDPELDSNKPTGSSQITTSNTAQPLKVQVVADDKQNSSGYVTVDDIRRIASADVGKSIYASTDMVTLNLRIVGDPDFVKQDDFFFNPASSTYDDRQQYLSNGGSLAMDAGEIFAMVKFKTPVDYDDITGGLRSEQKYRTGVFSGYFRVMKVDSEFKNGKFEQNLEMVRIFGQPEYDATGNKATQTAQRKAGVQTPKDVNKAITDKATKTTTSEVKTSTSSDTMTNEEAADIIRNGVDTTEYDTAPAEFKEQDWLELETASTWEEVSIDEYSGE